MEETKDIRNKIIDAYMKYRQGIIERYENPKHLKVVIIISPKAMAELMNIERYIENDREAECYYISLFSSKTPIVIRTDLPENIEFIIQSQSDYERQEKERLLDKFYKMFEEVH